MDNVSTTTVCWLSAMLGGTLEGAAQTVGPMNPDSMLEVVVCAAISAAAGWLVKKLFDAIERRIRCRSPSSGKQKMRSENNNKSNKQ